MTANLELLRRVGRKILPFSVFRRISDAYTFALGASRLGISQYNALRALSLDKTEKNLGGTVEFRMPLLLNPISVRPGTTDAGSVIHTVLRNGYGRYLPEGPVNFIIDAGANIGDTAAWYLTRFRDAHVVAVEPDPSNFRMLRRNCSAYGDRVRLLQKGLWSSSAFLKVEGDRLMESGLHVVEVQSEAEADCVAVSPMDLLEESRASHIDIFKCDIEGAESEVFGLNCDEWLSRTRSVFIEIHSRSAHDIVMSATRRHGFSCRAYRDIHIFHKSPTA